MSRVYLACLAVLAVSFALPPGPRHMRAATGRALNRSSGVGMLAAALLAGRDVSGLAGPAR